MVIELMMHADDACVCLCSPIFSHLAGKTSVWKAISPEVLEAAFNTTPEMEKLFRSKRLDSEIFFAPN
jgi:hypothetical protein